MLQDMPRGIYKHKKGKPSNALGKHWKLSKRARKNISEGHKGEKSYLWRGGITPKNQKLRNSKKYKEWRLVVFTRDNFTCVGCRKVGVYLEAHHIKSWAKYPKLRYKVNNGITLCKDCHKLTSNYKGKAKNK